ncbi:MAG: hypothetical protein ACREMO_09700, partial [Gemmatimonadales bacterium]
SLLTAGTYFFLIAAWVLSLRWWGQRLPYAPALYIWFVTNLARFIPGAVWQFAGLAAMTMARGVSPVAATGAVLIQQVVFLATGMALTMILLPQGLGGWATGLPPGLGIVLVGLLMTSVVFLMPVLFPTLVRLTGRLFGWELTLPAPRRSGLALYVLAMVVGWLAYGVAFWLFGRALLGDRAPDLPLALGAFIGSYVLGLLAIFAPGGIVVREAALVAALSSRLGAPDAILLAVASRLWLLTVEILTAGAVVCVTQLRRPALQP